MKIVIIGASFAGLSAALSVENCIKMLRLH